MKLSFEIPNDADGFSPAQCPLCSERFAIDPVEAESESVLEIRCPKCGMASDTFIPEEIEEAIEARIGNAVIDAINKEMKKAGRRSRGKAVRFRANEIKSKPEPKIIPEISDLDVVLCAHCRRRSKVSASLSFSAWTCPYCGVTNFNEQ